MCCLCDHGFLSSRQCILNLVSVQRWLRWAQRGRLHTMRIRSRCKECREEVDKAMSAGLEGLEEAGG